MTDEENKRYEEQRKAIEAMTQEQKMEKMDELLEGVFIMANSFAGDKGPRGVATYLHESANNIMRAYKILEGKAEPEVPVEFLMRSMGCGMGTSLIDLQSKQEMDED